MATCWNCQAFMDAPGGRCEFCGVSYPETKPRWIALLDAMPGPQDELPNFSLWYLAWVLVLMTSSLLFWPWWATIGAFFISLFLAAPATMLTAVLIQQTARLWQAARPRLIAPVKGNGLSALEEQTSQRLREDQESFDGLIQIITREQQHPDLLPDVAVVEYRKQKVLPVFSEMVRLSVSALLEIEIRRLINQCEQICDDIESCQYQEFNQRYEHLEMMQRRLGLVANRWSKYLLTRVTTPEVAVLSEKRIDYFDPRLQPDASQLTTEDLARLRKAREVLNTLRQYLHQTQELQLLRSAQPLHERGAKQQVLETRNTGLSLLLKQVQAPDRLHALEREYQRIVAEQRTIRDTTSNHLGRPDLTSDSSLLGSPPASDDFKKPIDAPAVLPNSLTCP